MNNEVNRQPRPLGTTQLSLIYQHSPKQENKSLIIKHVIKQYILQGFTFNHKHITIDQLSSIINIDVHTILREVNRQSQGLMDITNPEAVQDTVRALLSLGLRATLEDRGRVLEQVELLKRSQGESYKAFVSGEVRQGLDLLSKTGQNIITAAKALLPNQGTLININNTQTHEAQTYIDASKATQMIKASGHIPLKENPEGLQGLRGTYNLDEMPEVNAKLQSGRGGNEGLTMGTLTDLPTRASEKVAHNNRREEELGLDPESDEI
jgi:hypothetical protein